MDIKGSQDVIQEDNLSTRIDSPSKCDSSLLPTTESKTFFANLCTVSSLKEFKIALQRTLLKN
jgi:hypothetical protein